MPSTPFRVRPFSRNFEQLEANYHKFSLLFMFFYALESPIFLVMKDLFVLLSSINMHQVDPFVRPFITPTHFHVLCCSFKVFPFFGQMTFTSLTLFYCFFYF